MDVRRVARIALLLGAGVVVWYQVRTGCGGLGVAVGEPAPAFTATDVATRRPVGPAAFAGRPYGLLFFATWCPSCRDELPSVRRVLAERPLPFLAVSDEPPDRVASLLGSSPGGALPAAGDGREAFRAYGVHALPSMVVVGADGNIVFSGEGGMAVTLGLRRLTELAGP